MIRVSIIVVNLLIIFFILTWPNEVKCRDTKNRNQRNSANEYINTLRGSCQQYGHSCLGGHGKRSFRPILNSLGSPSASSSESLYDPRSEDQSKQQQSYQSPIVSSPDRDYYSFLNNGPYGSSRFRYHYLAPYDESSSQWIFPFSSSSSSSSSSSGQDSNPSSSSS